MKAQFINPFIRSAVEVFKQLGGITLEKTTLTLKEDPTPSNEISMIIGITGFISGQVVYSLKMHTAERIAKEMIPNQDMKIDQSFIESAMGEVANIITGRSTIELSGKDRKLHITPPTIVVGKDFQISFIKLKTISVSLGSRFGTLEVNIAIKEND
jgi:chemotaxis protein CheX